MSTISVIIPIYNSENSLKRCLDSLLSQSYKDWEAILVNDGSCDSSESICLEYSAKDNRFLYFFKENGGVSSARNLGLKKANGLYLAFLDSDDFIDPGYFDGFLSYLNKGFDVLQGGYKMISSITQYKYVYESVLIDLKKQSDVDFLQENYPDNGLCYPWGKLIKRDLVKDNDISFNEGMKFSEDLCFILDCLSFTNNLLFVPVNGMNYFSCSNMALKYRMDSDSYVRHCEGHFSSVSLFERKHNVVLGSLKDNYINFFYCFLKFFYSINEVKTKCSEMSIIREYDKGRALKILVQNTKLRGFIYYYSLYYFPLFTPFLLKIGMAKK